MTKKFLSLLLLGLLCSIGNVWGVDYHYVNTSTWDLTSNFRSALTQDGTARTIDGNSYTKTRKFGSTKSALGNPSDIGTNYIVYEVKTTVTSFDIYVYSTQTSEKKLFVAEVAEGASSATTTELAVAANKGSKLTYAVKGSTNSTIYFFVSDTKILVGDIVAKETGADLPTGGKVGFSMSFNKGRSAIKSGTLTSIEGMEFYLNSNYSALSSTAAPIKTNNTQYVKFTVANPMVLNFTTSSTTKYNVSTSKGTDDNQITPTANVAQLIKLRASGEYYINPQGSNVNITNIAFSAAPIVTYNANGGSGEMDQTYFTVAENDFTAPVDGQVFDGWKDGEGADYEVGDEVESNITLYAQWRTVADKHQVEYNGGGATGTLPTQDDVEEGQKFIVASADGLTAPSSGMVFRYWNDGVDNYEPGDEYTMETADVYLTAVWAQAYAVYFNTKGGSEIESQQVVEGETVTQPGNPTRPLSTFGGWYTDEECTSAYDFSTTITSATTINASNTLYAKWTFSTVTPGVYDAEQYVLDYGVGEDNTTAYVKTLTDANLALSHNDALDTYNDDKGKPAQNYPYLGLKIKTNNATLQGWIPADCYVVLKVGHMTADGTASWKGANTSIASSDTRNAKVYIFEPANEPSLFTFTTNTASTCVLKSVEVRAANAFPTYSSLVHTPDGYASFFSDYDVQIPAGVKANIGSFNESTRELTLTDIDGDIIPHQTAVILKGVGELTVLTALPSQSSQPEGNDLVGVNKEKSKSANGHDGGDVYVLGYNNDAACLASYAGSNLGANKAWLPVVAASAPSIRIIEANENATALDNMESTEKVVKIIENGQLFILKDGVRYNAIGQIVQ